MLESLIDNMFVIFSGRVYQQTLGVPMDTNIAPLLADMLIYSYEVDFITRASEEKRKAFTFTFCYIDDVLSLNNSKLGEFIDSINLSN